MRNTLEQLLVYPKTHRMPNLAVIGETNNGKTMLLENFLRRHAPNPDPTVDRVTLPVLLIQTPPDPDELRLYAALLERLQASGAAREPADSKLRRLKKILQDLQTKMVMLDEFQHALAGSPVRQRKFLNGLKYLGNELQIPMVVYLLNELSMSRSWLLGTGSGREIFGLAPPQKNKTGWKNVLIICLRMMWSFDSCLRSLCLGN